MQKIYGYGCITTSKTKNQIESDIENTKVFKNLKNRFDALGFDTQNIIIDVLNGNNLKRHKLYSLLDSIGDDLLVILDLNATGKKVEEILEFYQRIIENDIRLLVLDVKSNNGISKYSVCDLDGNRINDRQELVLLSYELARDFDLKDNRGKYAQPVSEQFIDAYWQYENYFIKEETAFKLAGGISKTVFYKWAKEYEQGHTDFDYSKALKDQSVSNNINLKPKRHGKRPEWFDDLMLLVEKGMSVSDGCDSLGVPVIHEIDYNRYKLKTGRKAMAQALYEFCKEEMLVKI